MRAQVLSVLMCLLIFCSTVNNLDADLELEDSNTVFSSSDVTISFSNGPNSGDAITGVYTVSFALSGTGTVTSLTLEISDGTTWSEVSTLTSSPWVTYLDSTIYPNGTYTLRATAFDSTAGENVVQIGDSFSIANQVPEIIQFEVLNPDYGTGSSASDRAWFNIDATDTLQFVWNALDDDLLRATLSNVPGPGAPANDGPSSINYGWDWSSGAFSEGTWNPRLTVYDNSGLNAVETIFMGIDRTGPTLGVISTGSSNSWSNTPTVTLTGLINSADDGQGSGISSTQYSLDSNVWESTTQDSITLTFEDGIHTISLRGIDNVGNVGPTKQVSVQVDTQDPIYTGWVVDELTTDRTTPANVEFLAVDLTSGIDQTTSFIEYGFDQNGFGQTPDITGTWLQASTTGLSTQIILANWLTKSRQYLMLRATVIDEAGNSITSSPTSYQILPSLDFSWNQSVTNIDRLVVKPGEASGKVNITSLLETNELYTGSVSVKLEYAPADRSSTVAWTTIEIRTLDAGSLVDGEELLLWNYTILDEGQFDLRLTIDPNNVIDEYDENNNNNFMVVTGAQVSSIIDAPSFNPSILLIFLCALAISYIQRDTRD